MAKPYIHALSAKRRWGGVPEDYLPIETYLDRSKGVIADSRHRALSHTSWFLFVLEDVFGTTITNSDGRTVSVRDIGEQHILEDFNGRFIPSASDYLEVMELQDWMIDGRKGTPPSMRKIDNGQAERKTIMRFDND